ncbi:MAG TPA: GMC family oxidoreductase N-terminal domain-containing protein [Steroidobacteraceae bacterium]|nr:GMC family oxidoreductase N-terminal domain-containing protein [Steroidobacteraceae bacterium]
MDPVDYIVVGAGTAGCLLAERLSANRQFRVLVLEAGGSDRRFWVRVPIGYGRTFNNPEVNWMYEAEPEPALGGVRSFWPRGKVLGGSGSINAMVYARGQPRDFEDWRALGNPGWGWSDVLPHYQAIEQRCGGSLAITDVSAAAHPLCGAYIEACATLGLKFTSDFNGPSPEGVGIYQINTRKGLRESTATAFLRPAMGRANLQLVLNAYAQLVDFAGRRAVGVTYRHGSETVSVRARRAVIIAAGSVNSPQLLQLSGVGPGAVLQRYGITPVLDLPAVGRNLQDHLGISFIYRSRVATLNNQLYPWWGKARAGMQYLLTRRGPLSMSVNQGGGFVRSSPELQAPDMQLYFNPASYTATRERTRRLMDPDPFPGFITSFNSCRPTSRGHVTIRSADPAEPPSIYPNYLSTEQDLRDVLAGSHLLRRLAAAAPLATVIESEMLPGAEKSTDIELLEDFRARAGTVFHPVGTCMMGPDPAHAVVDHRLRVHGLEGLRVIDASIFPTITSGNTNAPTAMIADKGASMVLSDADHQSPDT